MSRGYTSLLTRINQLPVGIQAIKKQEALWDSPLIIDY